MSRTLIPMTILFLLISGIALIFKSFLATNGFDVGFLLIANCLLFALSVIGFIIQLRGVNSPNINAFTRGMYGSLMLKLFIIALAILFYAFLTSGKVNKPSLFTSMGLYIVYTVLEVKQLTKLSRKKTNA